MIGNRLLIFVATLIFLAFTSRLNSKFADAYVYKHDSQDVRMYEVRSNSPGISV
jgi:hypothetical protein